MGRVIKMLVTQFLAGTGPTQVTTVVEVGSSVGEARGGSGVPGIAGSISVCCFLSLLPGQEFRDK